MPEGPTTEGSIVAYLRLNDSDWNEKLDAAEARAKELGRTDPTIRVNADTADAIAKLEAVRAAEDRAGGTTTTVSRVDTVTTGAGASDAAAKVDSVAAATKRLELAQSQLAAATERQQAADIRFTAASDAAAAAEDNRWRTVQKSTVSDDAKTKATDQAATASMRADLAAIALESSERKLADASAKVVAAQAAVEASQQKAAETAIEEAAAQEAAAEAERSAARAALEKAAADDMQAKSANNAAAGNKGNLGYMGLIVAAIAAAIPLGGALAGTTVAIAGGMAGMGAAGVLAILGVKNEMAQGTAVGNEYAAGISMLQSNMKELEATAAGGVLTGFDQSLAAIQAHLPDLNSEIRVFSGEMGSTASILTQGIVSALQVLNPLLVQGGFYVEQLAAGFTKWTHDGGLAKFAQDAIAALPQVTTALGSLLQGALNLIAALAPLGSIMLGVITLLGGLLSAIAPIVGNLSPLAAAAAAVYGGFMLWKQIKQPILDLSSAVKGFGLDLSIMGGLAGLAVAALGYIASSFVAARMESSSAASALQDYTAAVQEDNGVIGDNVRAQTAKALADKNALGQYNSLGISAIQIGRELGLSAQTVTQASLGQHSAIMKVNQVMTDYANNPANSTAKVAAFRANWINLTGVISDNTTKMKDALKAYNDIAAAQGLSTISTDAQLQAQQDLAGSYGMSLPQMLAAEAAQKQNADQAAATTQQLQFENDAATLLTNAFTLLNGGMLSVAQAQTGAAAAGNTLLDSLNQNGVAIDGNSKAAVANQQALEQKVSADQQAAEAIAKQTGSTQAGTAAFAASKQALIEQLKAAGNLTPAIQALIDQYYAVPPVVKTKAELDADAALSKAAALKAALDAIHNQTVTLTVVTNSVGAPATMPANVSGGAYKYAHGGEAGVGPAYLAVGGNPFRPRGTDTVPAMLTEGEFVVKQKSASYDPQFLKAYNADPARALAAKQGQGGATSVSLEGATIVLDVGGEKVTGVIRRQVVRAMGDYAQQISGGATV